MTKDIPIQSQIDEIKLLGLGIRDWLDRSKSGDIKRTEFQIERKQQVLEALRAVHMTLERVKAEGGGK